MSIGSRKPISSILREECLSNLQPDISFISHRFEMYRAFDMSSLSNLSNFGYLEHVLRITTGYDELADSLIYMPKNLKQHLQHIFKLSHRSQIENSSFLDSLSETDLVFKSNPPIKIVVYTYEENEYKIEEICPVQNNRWAVCYILSINYNLFMLYTPLMNFIDGFNPYSAECNDVIVPKDILEKAKPELYHESVQTQEECDSLMTDEYEYPSPTLSSPKSEVNISNVDYFKLGNYFNSLESKSRSGSESSDIEDFLDSVLSIGKSNLERSKSLGYTSNGDRIQTADSPGYKSSNSELINNSYSLEERFKKSRGCCGEGCIII
jgi:hypothetical protein